jgi:hypothetical protein
MNARISALATLATVSISALPMTPGPVLADDRKSYPASLCSSASNNLAYQQEGHIENTHASSAITVVCPLLRDTVADDLSIVAFRVWMLDRHPSQNVSCTIQSRQEDGDFVDSETKNSSGSSGNIQQHNFAVPIDSEVSGVYLMSCSIPPVSSGNRSGVISYVIDEDE